MAVLNWDEKYKLGIAKVDKQHTEIAEIINKLHDLLEVNDDKQKLKLLKKLIKTTKEHFETEEKLMTRHKVFNFFSHKAQHDRLLRILNELLEDVEDNGKEIGESFLFLMRDWMINHHRFHDIKMAKELIEKGAK